MNNDISKKNKSDWKKFIESNEKIEDKDFKELTSKLPYKEKVIDLHGYSLEEKEKFHLDFHLTDMMQGSLMILEFLPMYTLP